MLVDDDDGDANLYGAADIISATVTATRTGLEYSVTVRHAGQRPLTNVGLRILSNVDGKGRRTTVNLRPDGTVAALGAESPDEPETAEATTVTRSGNTITFSVPYDELGRPASRAPVHNVQVASYIGGVHDVALSPAGSTEPTSCSARSTRRVLGGSLTLAGKGPRRTCGSGGHAAALNWP